MSSRSPGRPFRSDLRRQHVGCPYCDGAAVLEIRYDQQPTDSGGAVTSVRLVCPNKCVLTDHIRDQLLATIARQDRRDTPQITPPSIPPDTAGK